MTGEGSHAQVGHHCFGTNMLVLVPGGKHNALQQKAWTEGQSQDHTRATKPLMHFQKELKEWTVHGN